ncbi:hypothetical protein FKP32DRAFT_1553087, partial [Trametes sanguinea]
SYGLYLAASAVTVCGSDGRTLAGATRACKLLLSEAAYLIWRLRCQRVIEWAETPTKQHSVAAVHNQWAALLRRRQKVDRLACQERYTMLSKLSANLVEATWTGLLDDDDSTTMPGVLVGIP